MDYRNLFQLENKVAVVIGAGSGIGRESAIGLAAFGAIVVCADINQAAAEKTAHEIGASAVAKVVDVTQTADIGRLVGSIAEERGRLDVVVLTPAINVRKPLTEYTDEDFDRVISVNLRGAFAVLRESGRLMSAQGGGSIVLFSSIRSQVVEPGQGIYAATKAGIVQMVRTLAAELGPQGVRVNAIAPGVVETPLTLPIKERPDWYQAYANKSVFRRWATPDEMVGAVVYLSSAASSYVTGSVLFVDGGWTAADGRFEPPV